MMEEKRPQAMTVQTVVEHRLVGEWPAYTVFDSHNIAKMYPSMKHVGADVFIVFGQKWAFYRIDQYNFEVYGDGTADLYRLDKSGVFGVEGDEHLTSGLAFGL